MADTIQTLQNLVKLAKKNVEDTQKQIADVLTAIEGLSFKIHKLQKNIADEAKAAGTDPMLLLTYSRYEERTSKEIADLKEKRLKLQRHEAALRDQLSDQFAEQKRHEILLERKRLERKQRIEKARQGQLDEIAATAHQNKNS